MSGPSWTAREVGRERRAGPSGARSLAIRALADWPELARTLLLERAFLRRAVAHLAATGVDQFLDLGAGLPTRGDVREVARRSVPRARVVAVDVDGATVAAARTLLDGDPDAAIVHADALDAATVLAAPEVAALLDLRRPVGVVAVGWVPFERERVLTALERYGAALAAGSGLVVTADAGAAEALEGTLGRAGFEIVAPGVVPADRWHPDTDGRPSVAAPSVARAAVGRRA